MGHSVLAMFTGGSAAPWPNDVPIDDHGMAGLGFPSVVRWKVFSLDNRLIARLIGKLSKRDKEACRRAANLILAVAQ